MSLVNLAHVCSHLQNASKVRLGLTSIPVSKMHVALMLGLQKEGFLSSVTLGGEQPPLPFKLTSAPTTSAAQSRPDSIQEEPWAAFAPVEEGTASKLLELAERKANHQESSGQETAQTPDITAESSALPQHPYRKPRSDLPALSEHISIPSNPAKRRLWLGLKYWRSEPVLSKMNLVSKPTKRIWCTHQDLFDIARGKNIKFIKGIVNPGECMFITTDKGILEIRECIKRRLGGTVLCRVS